MTERKKAVAARFDSAHDYDAAARIQKRCVEILARKIALTYAQTPPRHILEFGCGTGALTEALSHLFPEAKIEAIDLSPHMIARAQARIPSARFTIMDAERPQLSRSYDLICSSLCLQWFTDRAQGLARLSRHVAPGGRMMIATLAERSFQEWRAACAAARVPCQFPDYPPLSELEREWPPCGHGVWEQQALIDQPGDSRGFLRDLKRIGADLPKADAQRQNSASLRRVMRRFDQGERRVTYDIAFGSFQKPRGVFVTGTDTGIGKTLVSAILTRAWDAFYWKPLQTGLADEAGDTPTVAHLTQAPAQKILPPAYALQAPLAPWEAAQRESVTIAPNRLALPDVSPLVVEGAGGLMVPVTAQISMIDLIADYGLPVVLVARSGLGTINHTLLSLEALRTRDIAIAGVVLSGPLNPGNRAAIETFGRVKILAEIPHLDTIDAASVATLAADIPRLETL
ncbi:dethiobiotin synthase [Kozakia baliensis]|uniref:dethiobiotin synthase n=1 Tax=Kozakia baliensis TaxID=153496 RepID=UPI000495CBA9|nr:dethiobiotin synthase [Kozakia baliensis]